MIYEFPFSIGDTVYIPESFMGKVQKAIPCKVTGIIIWGEGMKPDIDRTKIFYDPCELRDFLAQHYDAFDERYNRDDISISWVNDRGRIIGYFPFGRFTQGYAFYPKEDK